MTLLCGLVLSLHVALPAPAAGTVMPTGGGIRGTAESIEFSVPKQGQGSAVSCTTSTLRGAFAADGQSLSGNLFPGDECTGQLSGSSAFLSVTCDAFFTLSVVSEIAGVQAVGDLTIEKGAGCKLAANIDGFVCSLRVRGPQGPIASAATLNQTSQTLSFKVRGMKMRGTGGPCGGANQSMTFVATFELASEAAIV